MNGPYMLFLFYFLSINMTFYDFTKIPLSFHLTKGVIQHVEKCKSRDLGVELTVQCESLQSEHIAVKQILSLSEYMLLICWGQLISFLHDQR